MKCIRSDSQNLVRMKVIDRKSVLRSHFFNFQAFAKKTHFSVVYFSLVWTSSHMALLASEQDHISKYSSTTWLCHRPNHGLESMGRCSKSKPTDFSSAQIFAGDDVRQFTAFLSTTNRHKNAILLYQNCAIYSICHQFYLGGTYQSH